MRLLRRIAKEENRSVIIVSHDQRIKEIADELIISVTTVMRHAHNIYGKLGVKRRTQAMAQARTLALL